MIPNCFRIATLLAVLSAAIMISALAQTAQSAVLGYTDWPDGKAL